jgi:uncharacterized damage-inducible protein DinB
MQRPADTEYAAFYARYVALVPESDILAVLEAQVDEIRRLLAPVSAENEAYRYAEGKWSIRQVLGHLVDGERIFGYRAFCFGRGEKAGLPSFDENEYVASARSDEVPLCELVDELALVRQANLSVLRRLDAREWVRVGTASGKPVSVRAIAWVLAGHPRHHVQVLRERYGVA